MIYCHECGMKVEESFKFCPHCSSPQNHLTVTNLFTNNDKSCNSCDFPVSRRCKRAECKNRFCEKCQSNLEKRIRRAFLWDHIRLSQFISYNDDYFDFEYTTVINMMEEIVENISSYCEQCSEGLINQPVYYESKNKNDKIRII